MYDDNMIVYVIIILDILDVFVNDYVIESGLCSMSRYFKRNNTKVRVTSKSSYYNILEKYTAESIFT